VTTTFLTLSATPGRRPWLNVGNPEAGGGRPNNGQFTGLWLDGTAHPYRAFLAKDVEAPSEGRPNSGIFTVLRVNAIMGVPQTFTAKTPSDFTPSTGYVRTLLITVT